ncbi:MAG: GHKL domain-containing protein [Calditrichaeota bacterium]|nr:MAG: GHKL domain-containing protein [Calditrichota bacterium]
MQSLRKIRILLILIVLVPTVFIISYQFLSLAEHKNLIEETYRKQLKTILFSVNQNTRNIVENWIALFRRSVLADVVLRDGVSAENLIIDFLKIESEIVSVFLLDKNLDSFRLIEKNRGELNGELILAKLQEANVKTKLHKLVDLHKKQFLTFESVYLSAIAENPTLLLIIFTVAKEKAEPDFAGFILPAETVIETIIAPEMRRVAGSDFVLSCYDEQRRQPIYSTAAQPDTVFDLTNKLWIMPGFQLGIQLEIAELPGLLQAQFQRTVWFLVFLSSTLVVAGFLIYRNIRKDLYLTQLKSDFVSNVSHELKTPLALIRMFSETLELGRVGDENKKQEYYGIIRHETERLSHKVNNILNFSRMEAGKKEYKFKIIDLNSIIDRLVHNYAYHIENEGFELIVDKHTAPLNLLGDSEALTEAFINVIDNAMKYSPEDKFLKITTSSEHDGVAISIEDHGIGIKREHLKKIFEKFYRVSGALVHETKGSGLGLSLVKHIIKAHQGEIIIKSEPGKGSVFQFFFPNSPCNDN